MSMELPALDRAVVAAAAALAKDRAALALGGESLPCWIRHRAVARKSLYDELLAKDVLSHERAPKEALLAWIAELTVARVAAPAEVDLARALSAPVARVEQEATALVSFRDVVVGLLSASNPDRARAHVAALVARAPAIAA